MVELPGVLFSHVIFFPPPVFLCSSPLFLCFRAAALQIYHEAIKQNKYTCFLKEDSMMRT
jgi:hypothetical protein